MTSPLSQQQKDALRVSKPVVRSVLRKYFTRAGTIAYTLTGAGGAATFNADCNYGLSKYEDFGNQDFSFMKHGSNWLEL